MAEIKLTQVKNKQGSTVVTWKEITNNDHAEWIDLSDYSDKTMHVSGVMGSATLTLYGSNNDADLTTGAPASGTAVILKDNQDNNIAKTTTGTGDIIIENYRYISAQAAGGGGTTSITLAICGRRVRS